MPASAGPSTRTKTPRLSSYSLHQQPSLPFRPQPTNDVNPNNINYDKSKPITSSTTVFVPPTTPGLSPNTLTVTNQPLGRGSFGSVWLASFSGSPVAVKVCPLQSNPQSSSTSIALQHFCRETARYQQLRHPCIVQYFGVVHDTQNHSLLLVTDLMRGGSLFDALRALRSAGAKRLFFSSVLRIAGHIANGLEYLHSLNFSFGDLKSMNVLLSERPDLRRRTITNTTQAKLCDFGLSRNLNRFAAPNNQQQANNDNPNTNNNNKFKKGGPPGTFAYMAPEVFAGEEAIKHPADAKAADVYALGVVLWELATLRVPWEGKQGFQLIPLVVEQRKRPEWPTDDEVPIQPDYAALVEKCWSQDASDRPSASSVSKTLATMRNTLSIALEEERQKIKEKKQRKKLAQRKQKLLVQQQQRKKKQQQKRQSYSRPQPQLTSTVHEIESDNDNYDDETDDESSDDEENLNRRKMMKNPSVFVANYDATKEHEESEEEDEIVAETSDIDFDDESATPSGHLSSSEAVALSSSAEEVSDSDDEDFDIQVSSFVIRVNDDDTNNTSRTNIRNTRNTNFNSNKQVSFMESFVVRVDDDENEDEDSLDDLNESSSLVGDTIVEDEDEDEDYDDVDNHEFVETSQVISDNEKDRSNNNIEEADDDDDDDGSNDVVVKFIPPGDNLEEIDSTPSSSLNKQTSKALVKTGNTILNSIDDDDNDNKRTSFLKDQMVLKHHRHASVPYERNVEYDDSTQLVLFEVCKTAPNVTGATVINNKNKNKNNNNVNENNDKDWSAATMSAVTAHGTTWSVEGGSASSSLPTSTSSSAARLPKFQVAGRTKSDNELSRYALPQQYGSREDVEEELRMLELENEPDFDELGVDMSTRPHFR